MIFVLTVAATVMSCNRKTVYDRYQPVAQEGWNKDDTLVFTVRPVKQGGVFKEEVGLRTTGDYPFMGLCLIVEQTVLPSAVTRYDTLNCRLTSDDGNIKGRGVSCYQYRFHLTNITLADGDSLCVRIRHNMRRETMPGITDVGMRIYFEDGGVRREECEYICKQISLLSPHSSLLEIKSVSCQIPSRVYSQEDEEKEREAPQ